VPTYNFWIYEVPNSYVESGTSPTISAVVAFEVRDNDGNLEATEALDPGSSQRLYIDGDRVDSYEFFYDDTITINGGTETIKTFQVTIDGTTRSFVMSDDGPSIPGVGVGTSFTLDAYSGYTSVPYADVACFVRGTLIETKAGQKSVEDLRVGDLVRTADHGLQPIRWVGASPLSTRDLLARPHLRPIRIPANCFGPNQPAQDLYVSPQHRVMLEGGEVQLNLGLDQALAPAKSLVGRNGIDVDAGCRTVDYFHFMFDRHEVVFSEGLATESFLVGDTIRDGMDAAQLEEILELFPELAEYSPESGMISARPVLKVFEVNVLGDLAA